MPHLQHAPSTSHKQQRQNRRMKMKKMWEIPHSHKKNNTFASQTAFNQSRMQALSEKQRSKIHPEICLVRHKIQTFFTKHYLFHAVNVIDYTKDETGKVIYKIFDPVKGFCDYKIIPDINRGYAIIPKK